jgi:predicted Rossmann fold nucleotide-binding protein DprA/Smf involved in DNA uptake
MPFGLSHVAAALYLPGLPGCLPPRTWPAVAALWRVCGGEAPALSALLRRQGLWAEALLLEDRARLGRAAKLVASGQAVTAACCAWPGRLRRASSCPPAWWVRGPVPPGPFVAVAGSRALSGAEARYARAVGAEAARLGYSLVSGGAWGADRAAAEGALEAGGSVLEILPHGLGAGVGTPGACWASLCAPEALFSAPRAMARNALIYVVAEGAVVVAARYREGGTWHGAAGALRRRATRVWVRPDARGRAARALIALGAAPLASAADLGPALRTPPPCLFSGVAAAYAALRAG